MAFGKKESAAFGEAKSLLMVAAGNFAQGNMAACDQNMVELEGLTARIRSGPNPKEAKLLFKHAKWYSEGYGIDTEIAFVRMCRDRLGI